MTRWFSFCVVTDVASRSLLRVGTQNVTGVKLHVVTSVVFCLFCAVFCCSASYVKCLSGHWGKKKEDDLNAHRSRLPHRLPIKSAFQTWTPQSFQHATDIFLAKDSNYEQEAVLKGTAVRSPLRHR